MITPSLINLRGSVAHGTHSVRNERVLKWGGEGGLKIRTKQTKQKQAHINLDGGSMSHSHSLLIFFSLVEEEFLKQGGYLNSSLDVMCVWGL